MKTVFNVMLLLVVIVSATAFSSCKEKRGELKKIWSMEAIIVILMI